jgi:phage baseplate assembly protein W
MALVPENYSDILDEEEAAEAVVEPSKTWAINFEAGTIGKFIDEGEALRQYIRKAILTERARFSIYSDDYGCELNELIGDDVVTEDLLDAEIPRLVYEALAYDERIEDVQTTFTREGDKLFINVTVVPADNDVEITEEVEVNV